MKVVFIRHGESDYLPCEERGFVGHGRDLAPLSSLGTQQAERISKNTDFCDCEVIVSSPYTRALQTAAIISRNTGIKIEVDVDLHEWCPDKTYQYKRLEQLDELHKDFVRCKGEYSNGDKRNWETINEIIDRVIPVLDKYLERGFNKIIIVTHGGIIRRFIGESNIKYCIPYEVDYNKEYQCIGWIN